MPLPDAVTAFLEAAERGGEPLTDALRRWLRARLGETPPADVWDGAALPAHLRIEIRVVDGAGTELAEGRDLAALRVQLGEAAQLSFAQAGPSLDRRGLRSWDFGDLPETLATVRGGQRFTGFPALADDGDSASIVLLDTREAAEASLRAGVVRLIRIALKEHLARYEKGGAGFAQAALQLRTTIPTEALQGDVMAAVCDRAFVGDDPLPRSEKAFAEQVKRARTRLPAVAEGAFRVLATIAALHHALAHRMGAMPRALAHVVAEVRSRRDGLVHPGFFHATPWPQLAHLPRYLTALDRRLAKIAENPARDARHAEAVARWWDRYREREDKNRTAGRVEPGLEEFRWLLEELQVSLFAQELKTPVPVSYKRLERAWTELGR